MTQYHPYFTALSQNLLTFAEQRDTQSAQIIQQLQDDKAKLLNIVRQIKDGEILLENLVVTDEGISVLPPEPEDDDSSD